MGSAPPFAFSVRCLRVEIRGGGRGARGLFRGEGGELDHEGPALLAVRDVYSFGQDYARTLREWHARFDAAEPQVVGMGYDTGFRRGWRLYLGMCAAAFALGRTDVHQIELRPV